MPSLPKDFPSHFPKSKKEEQEFGKGKKDIMVCKRCKAVYFYKSWHHRLKDYPKIERTKRLKFTICPACRQIIDNKFEGEIILENVPEKLRGEIKKLAENFGKRAFEKDPMDRVISVKEKKVKSPTNARKRGASSRKDFKGKTDILILTTENQLAQRLAKKLSETFKGKLETSFSHSKKESTLRARITF